VNIDPEQRAEQRRIAAELARIGFVLPGSLLTAEIRCGKPTCRCRATPPVLHGPYWRWTRKVAGKTVTVRLTDEQARDYQPWIDNARHLRDLTRRLERIAVDILETDPRHP
jgi:hypothetical protein